LGSCLRAGRELLSCLQVSSQESRELINIFLAGANVWVSLIEEVLNNGLLVDELEQPPGRGDEVPDGVSTGDDGASEGVQTVDKIVGQGRGHHGEGNVDTSSGDGNSLSNEKLETSIGVWDGFTFTLGDDSGSAREL